MLNFIGNTKTAQNLVPSDSIRLVVRLLP